MSESAGFNTCLRYTGASVSMTDESMTDTGNGTLFRIDDSSKEILDPQTSMTVKSNGSSVSASNYTINYLTGSVDFDSSQAGNTITISGAYLPAYDVAEAYATTFNRSYGEIDTTVFKDEGFTRTQGLAEIEVEVSHLDAVDDPLDGQGGTENTLTDLLTKYDEPFVVEYQPSGLSNVTSGTREGRVHRAWVKLPNRENTTEVDGRYEVTSTLVSSEQDSTMSTQSVVLFDSFNP